MPALTQLASRSPIPTAVTGDVPRFPAPVEAALYFVCSEALANAAKHSDGSRVSLELRQKDADIVVAIADDGVGGADPTKGSGLRGLADRVEALGGRFAVASSPGRGTRIDVVLPAAATRLAAAD
jgi:signal transduction histidine kinase